LTIQELQRNLKLDKELSFLFNFAENSLKLLINLVKGIILNFSLFFVSEHLLL